MTLFGIRVFALVIEIRISRSFWSRMGPHPMTSVLRRGRREKTHRHRKEVHVKKETESRMTWRL